MLIYLFKNLFFDTFFFQVTLSLNYINLTLRKMGKIFCEPTHYKLYNFNLFNLRVLNSLHEIIFRVSTRYVKPPYKESLTVIF